jgi:tagatose 1,6-diphosphate aldolase
MEDATKRPELVFESVKAFADSDYGVDIFKLESPIPADKVPEPGTGESERVQALFDRLGELAGRPWVMLSAGASRAAFRRVLHYAFKAGASGFLAGRAIWWDAFARFPDLDAMEDELGDNGLDYLRELQELALEHATPWQKHPLLADGVRVAGVGLDFPERYPDFEPDRRAKRRATPAAQRRAARPEAQARL